MYHHEYVKSTHKIKLKKQPVVFILLKCTGSSLFVYYVFVLKQRQENPIVYFYKGDRNKEKIHAFFLDLFRFPQTGLLLNIYIYFALILFQFCFFVFI